MFKKIALVIAGLLLLISAAGYAAAGPGKVINTAFSRQVSSQARSQLQKQMQVDQNGAGPQIKTRKQTRTNYIK